MGVEKIEVETYAAIVAEWINSSKVIISDVGLNLDDVKQLLQNLSCSNVKFIPRHANNMAHCLAKLALSSSDNHMWFEDYPSFIRRNLLADCLGSQ
ncbi:hypothetical protein Q3G72_011823 [Acer saccharum]|nr:hypothetical protein Q3G72_011823 [Acer saccharum]